VSITVESMKDRLKTLEEAQEFLAITEPLNTFPFSTGDGIRFHLEPGWNHGIDAMGPMDVIEKAQVRVGEDLTTAPDFFLTKDALLEFTSQCGLPKPYVSKTPANFIEDQLNYWFRLGMPGKDYKMLVTPDNERVVALTKATITPFSNLRLVDEMLGGIAKMYGEGEVLVDYKFQHDLRNTHLRLIVPESVRTLKHTGTDDDEWSMGIQLKNSLIGAKPTELNGYLFRWTCTNGAIDTHAATGAFSRRGSDNDVYEWARQAVDQVLGGLEGSLGQVQALAHIPIEGQAKQSLADVFQLYKVPGNLRDKVMEIMVETQELTMYAVMQAITAVANEVDMSFGQIEMMMRAGGDLPHRADSRCDTCHRINA